MSLSRKSFLGSVAAIFAGLPLFSQKKKLKESFSIEIEEIGSNRFRATLKTAGVVSFRMAVIESIPFTSERPENAWAQTARLKFLFDINRALGIHLFREDEHVWKEWNLEGPYPEITHKPVEMQWPPSTISCPELDPDWYRKYHTYHGDLDLNKSVATRFKQHMTNFFRKNPKV